jgi:hypothetical protein
VGYPFAVVRYPPITDYPIHASCASVLRHYLDPAWHFREQFEVHPIESPNVVMYAFGAVLALFMPITWASKLMACAMIVQLPIGLSVLSWGMRKSPLWGLLGLGLAWSTLTQWGMLNHIGSVGLMATSIGLTLRLQDRPTRRAQFALVAALFGVFITHVWRLPFTLVAIGLTTVVMYPYTRRIWPVVPPTMFGFFLLLVWRLAKRKDMGTPKLNAPDWPRFGEVKEALFGGYHLAEERLLAEGMLKAFGGVLVIAVVFWLIEGRYKQASRRVLAWNLGVTLLPLVLSAFFVLAFLTLPMEVGIWWYVFPREIVTAVYVGLLVVPDLPRNPLARAATVAIVVFAVGKMALFNAKQFFAFDVEAENMARVIAHIPPAPRLMFLVFDHSGSTRTASPFVHLPQHVMAERGGWVSWHFASINLYPITYRTGRADVPPQRPPRWEWTPHLYDHRRDSAFFDTFLIRSATDPTRTFGGDSKIVPVAREGKWWIYRKTK